MRSLSSARTIVKSSLFRRYFGSYVLAILVPVAAAVFLVGVSVLSDLRARDELAHESLLTDLARFTDYRLEGLVDAMTTVASQEPIRRLSGSRTTIDPLGDPIENFQIIVSRSSLQEQLNAILRSSESVRSVFVFFSESRSVLTIDGRYSFEEFLNRVHHVTAAEGPLPWESRFPTVYVELWRSVHRRAPRAEISDITNTARRFRNALWIFALGALILAVVYAYRQSFRFYMPVVTLRRLIERADTDLDSSSNAEEFEILERWAQTVLHERELDQQRLSRLQPLALADLIRRTINGATLDEHERSIVDVELLPTRIVAVRIDPLVSSDHGWDRRSVDLLPMVRCWFGVGPNEIVVATNSASSESDVRTLHKDLCSRLVGCRVTTGVGPVVRDRDELATCAAKCRRLVHLRRLSRDHELVRDTDIATDLPAEPFITDSEATRLANLARLADADSLVAEIERFIGEMTGSHTCERAVKALASDLLAMVFRASQSGTDPNYEMGRLIEWNNQLDSAFTVEDILTVLRDSVEELCRPAGGRSEHEAAIEGNPR